MGTTTLFLTTSLYMSRSPKENQVFESFDSLSRSHKLHPLSGQFSDLFTVCGCVYELNQEPGAFVNTGMNDGLDGFKQMKLEQQL